MPVLALAFSFLAACGSRRHDRNVRSRPPQYLDIAPFPASARVTTLAWLCRIHQAFGQLSGPLSILLLGWHILSRIIARAVGVARKRCQELCRDLRRAHFHHASNRRKALSFDSSSLCALARMASNGKILSRPDLAHATRAQGFGRIESAP